MPFAAARSGDDPTTPATSTPEQAEGMHVHDADEAGPDDAGAERLGAGCHGCLRYSPAGDRAGRSSSTDAAKTSLKPGRPIPTGMRSPVGRNPDLR